MAQAPAAIFKITTESPQPPRGKASRARKAVTAPPRAACRVAGIETRAATRYLRLLNVATQADGQTQILGARRHVTSTVRSRCVSSARRNHQGPVCPGQAQT